MLDIIGNFPVIIRPAFTLGGTGGGIAYNMEEFKEIMDQGLAASVTKQVWLQAQGHHNPRGPEPTKPSTLNQCDHPLWPPRVASAAPGSKVLQAAVLAVLGFQAPCLLSKHACLPGLTHLLQQASLAPRSPEGSLSQVLVREAGPKKQPGIPLGPPYAFFLIFFWGFYLI